MAMPGRKYQSEKYRYGFGGMEKDNEVKGEGNSYTTEWRQYDPRLGRWLSLDPKMAKYPNQSPYVAFNNNPIFFTDPFGDDPPEGFKKHTGQGGDVYLPESATTASTENCTTGVQELTSFSIGSKTFSAQYDTKGGFTGYFDGTTKYENPDVTVRSGGGITGTTLNATFDVKNVPASGLNVVQTFYGTRRTDGLVVGCTPVDVSGTNCDAFVDGGDCSPAVKLNGEEAGGAGVPYYMPMSWYPKLPGGYAWNGTSGNITAYDVPGAVKAHDQAVFETTIVATNYMNTGKDVKLATFRWGWNSNGTVPIHTGTGITITPITPTSLKIISNDYPTYQFFK
jgi:RHS repeat-associated protein